MNRSLRHCRISSALALIFLFAGCMTVERPDLKEAIKKAGGPESGIATAPAHSVPACSIKGHVESLQENFEGFEYPEDGVFENRETYSLELRGADLDHALNLIAEMGGINLFLRGNFTDPIDVSFPEIQLNDAFKTLLENYNCTLVKDGGIFVVNRADPGNYLSHIFTLRSASSPDIEENLKTLLGEEVKPILSPEGDKVMITAPPDTILRVARYLDSVDQPEKQVIIEARIVEVVLSDLFKLGAELDFRDISMDDTTSRFLSGFLPDLAASDNRGLLTTTADKSAIDGTLEVLKELTRVEILSRPRVLAKNGAMAKIEVIEEVPYVDATTTTNGTSDGVGTSTVQEVVFKEVGLKLTVTPYIKGDNSVELLISQDASEEVDKFLDIPVVDRRIVDTTLVVHDGELAVIGGLITSVARDEVSGIPLLMEIPLLGNLFKTTSQVTDKRELMILISPTVVTSGSLPIPTDGYTELVSADS